MHRFLPLVALLSLPAGPAAAQSFFLGDGCDGLSPCEGTACPGLDDHPVSIAGVGCRCAPGAAGDPLPIQCCSTATTSCPSGAMCRLFTDSARQGICIPPGITYCGDDGTGIDTFAEPCHTTPGGLRTPFWRDGDCDGDGTANAAEVTDPLRDPCCHVDADCCLEDDLGTPAECCALANDPATCCAGSSDPVACCASQTDFASCCAELSDEGIASHLECCVATPLGTDGACCSIVGGLTGDACCEALDGTPDLCCAAGITTCDSDAGVADEDAGAVEVDGGTLPQPDAGVMDAGPEPLPPETVQFGGGGGCVCSAATPRAPSMLGIIAALAVAIPAALRRTRR